MASKVRYKTTFEPHQVIEPIYTGGSVALSKDGQLLATCVGEDVLLTDLTTGRRRAKLDGDGEIVTTLALAPAASHLILCSRSLSMRIYRLDNLDNGLIEPVLLRSLKPHSSPVVSSTIDNTGSLLATGGADGIVKVWDIRGGFATHTFHGHSGVVSALHFFSVVTGDQDDKSHNKKRKLSQKPNGKADLEQGHAATFRLASGDEEGKVRIWHLSKRKCIANLDSHVSVIRGLDFDSRQGLLLSASRDKTVILWDSLAWEVRTTIPVLETIEAAGFSKQRGLLYTGGETGKLRFWWTTGQEATVRQENNGEGQGIVDLIAKLDESFMVSIHADQTILFHSTALLEEDLGTSNQPLPIVRRISGTHDEVIDVAFVGGANDILALATNIEEVRLVSLATTKTAHDYLANNKVNTPYFGADIGLLQGHDDIVICLDVDWSGHWLATGSKDNTARLWRIDPATDSFTCWATFTGHAESLGAIALSRATPAKESMAYRDPLKHPPSFVITGSQDKTIKRWDMTTQQQANKAPTRATYTRKAHEKDINALDVTTDSKLFASASQDRTVKIWSFEDGEAIGVLRGHKRGVWTVRFAPPNMPAIDGEGGVQASSAKGVLLTGSGDKTVKVWSLSDYSCLRTLEGHTNSVLKVVWLCPPQEKHLPADDENNDLATLATKRAAQIVSAGGDGLVKVWDASSGELECTLDNHTDRVWALTVDTSDNTLVSGGGDSVITFWKDTTSETAAASAAASNERIEQDQELQNYIRAGSYRSAITLALQLNHPARLLALFTSVVATSPPEQGSLCGVKAVDTVLANLSDEQLLQLLARIRDWNTNARKAPVAQKILWALLKSYPAARFTQLKQTSKGGPSITELLDALKVYTERHYNRLEDLIDESFLVDYTLMEMDEISGTNAVVNGTNGVERQDALMAET